MCGIGSRECKVSRMAPQLKLGDGGMWRGVVCDSASEKGGCSEFKGAVPRRLAGQLGPERGELSTNKVVGTLHKEFYTL